MIVAKDHIDFVELRARIHNHEFLGISSIKESKSQVQHGDAAWGTCTCSHRCVHVHSMH